MDDLNKILKLIGKLDISTPEKISRFQIWKLLDGSLKGLQKIYKINREMK